MESPTPAPPAPAAKVANSIPSLLIDGALYDKSMTKLILDGISNQRDLAKERGRNDEFVILHHAAIILEDYHNRVAPLPQPKSGRIVR